MKVSELHAVFLQELGALLPDWKFIAEFNQLGLPFLERYSVPSFTAAVLQACGPKAQLISPFEQNHAGQILALQELSAPPNSGVTNQVS